MKLLYITNGINGSGGLERVLSIKASALAEEWGYEVGIVVLNETHKNLFYIFSPQIQMLPVEVSGNPIQYLKQYKTGVQKVVDDFQPDIISVCDDGIKGFLLPKFIKTKAKWIYERHASTQLNKAKGWKGNLTVKAMQYLAKRFDRFIVLTPSNIKEWKKIKAIAIPNPLSFPIQKGNPLDQKKVIAVGSHSYNKGYDLLLKVWQEVHKKYPDWELHIYGKSDPQQTYIRLKEEWKVLQCYFHEPVSDIRAKYLDSSIMVLPSRSEGFGMVLIEAMACGLPCISFDCPSGPRDIIEHDVDGILVPAENISAMVKAFERLIGDKRLRKDMGQKAIVNVKRYSSEQILKHWEGLFHDLVNNKHFK